VSEHRTKETGNATDVLARKVTVCDRCLQASCWQAIFMCQEAQNAGTREASVAQLALLRAEAPDYWFRDPCTGVIDHDAVRGVYVFDENALYDFIEAAELPDLRDTISRPVMNSPADEAEARDRAQAAPRQADPDAPGRGVSGVTAGSEARPVTATEHRPSKTITHAEELRMLVKLEDRSRDYTDKAMLSAAAEIERLTRAMNGQADVMVAREREFASALLRLDELERANAGLATESEELRHDIARHVAICAEQTTESERLRSERDKAQQIAQAECVMRHEAYREWDRLKARIDALMLEYCPDEMTPEQTAEWARNQVPADETSGLESGCHRSHPHEDMLAECRLKAVRAFIGNRLRRLPTNPACESTQSAHERSILETLEACIADARPAVKASEGRS
jgi:hypothetical protein